MILNGWDKSVLLNRPVYIQWKSPISSDAVGPEFES